MTLLDGFVNLAPGRAADLAAHSVAGPNHSLSSTANAEFLVDMPKVHFDCREADKQGVCDLVIAEAFTKESQDLALPWRE